MRTRAPSRRYESVQHDWRALLPQTKACLFFHHTEALENDYLMLSVSLNEVLNYQRAGKPLRNCREIEMLGALCARLAIRINAVLHGMWQHARHFGIVPNLAPLEAANFKSERGHRGARYNQILSRVLLSERSQFLNKLNTLEEMVDAIGDEFIIAVRKLEECTTSEAPELLQALDFAHFDLNTCLRETDVLLKSFLLVLPEDQLGNFDFTVKGLARARRPLPFADGLLDAGRIRFVAGQ
jgi:hypothetical protein